MYKLEERELAFFCVADGYSYLPYTITTLLSVKRFLPNAGFFVIGKFKSEARCIDLLNRKHLDFLYLDLSTSFKNCRKKDNGTGGWPSECFWWTYAYKPLSDLGYAYSCLLDGDVLCNQSFEPAKMLSGHAISGVAKGSGRINSGVLMFDHAKMHADQMFEKFLQLYRTQKNCNHLDCTGYCREKGDQGLLWEIERQGVNIGRISNVFNHLLTPSLSRYKENNVDCPEVDDSVFLHYLLKPWASRFANTANPVYNIAHKIWWDYAEELWGKDNAEILGEVNR